MKRTILILLVSLAGALCAPNLHGQLATGDPFIVTDARKGIYYMYGSSLQKTMEGQATGGMAIYRSGGLKTWEGPLQVFTVSGDKWITAVVWVPETYV